MSAEAVDLLRSIDSTLKALLALTQQRTAQMRATAPKPVASDRELDSKYGDPKVKFMPRDWSGPSFVGRLMSECPAELLDLLAETFDYFGDKAERENEMTDKGKPVAAYKRQDAARARGWAKRVRDGKVPAGVSGGQPEGWEGEDDSWR